MRMQDKGDYMKALIELMLGLFIITLDGRAQMNIILVNVITDVAGYGLLIAGMTGLIPWSPCFKKGRWHAAGALVFSIGLRVVQYLELTQEYRAVAYGMTAVFYIYMTFYIVEGIDVKCKTEKRTEQNANLRGIWIVTAAAQMLYSFCSLVDLQGFLEGFQLGVLTAPLRAVLGVLAFVANSFFVITINQIRIQLFPKREETAGKSH